MALNNQRLTEDIMIKVRDYVNKRISGGSSTESTTDFAQDLKQVEDSIRTDLTAVETQNKAVLLQISSLSKSMESLKNDYETRIKALEKQIATLKPTTTPAPITTSVPTTILGGGNSNH